VTAIWPKIPALARLLRRSKVGHKMEPTYDYTNGTARNLKNFSLLNNDPKTHTVIGIAERILVPIDEELVNRLGIKDGDILSQIVDDAGRLVFTKNKIIGNHHEANIRDYEE
jgi:predicted molibdopterin-dependent oxidoreductase YjgC